MIDSFPLGVERLLAARRRLPAKLAMSQDDPLHPLKIQESRLLFIYFADIRRGAAGRTDCCSRMAGL